MNSKLNKEDLIFLLTQQERFDADLRERFEISLETWRHEMFRRHDIALRVEVAEFVNEARIWKYWKKKPIERDKLVDEAVDILHFVMLILNKDGLDVEVAAESISDYLKQIRPASKEDEVEELLHEMLVMNLNELAILKRMLVILDYFDFDRKQIMSAYKNKNDVNFERLSSGY